MINPGDSIYINPKTSKAYSKPGKERVRIGQLRGDQYILEEGTRLNICMENRAMGVIEPRGHQPTQSNLDPSNPPNGGSGAIS